MLYTWTSVTNANPSCFQTTLNPISARLFLDMSLIEFAWHLQSLHLVLAMSTFEIYFVMGISHLLCPSQPLYSDSFKYWDILPCFDVWVAT